MRTYVNEKVTRAEIMISISPCVWGRRGGGHRREFEFSKSVSQPGGTVGSGRRFWYCSGMSQSVICRDPEVMSGTPVFRGTRVPVQTLIEYLEAGDSIDEFLEGFPTVTRDQVIAFLEEAKEKLVESVS